MIVSIYLLFTVLRFIRTVFLHVLNMLFGLMTTRLNKRYYSVSQEGEFLWRGRASRRSVRIPL